MAWDQVKLADREHTEALTSLEVAQAATATAEKALQDAQAAYEEARAAERQAENAAELAQYGLVEISKEVNIDYPPEQPVGGVPPAPAARR